MRFRSTLFALIASGMIVTAAQAANVLVVLSDENHLDLKDGKTFETGFYLNELIQPVEILRAAGHQLTFATPKGLAPSLDKSSIDPMYYGGDTNALAKSQAVLEQLGLTDAKRSPVISLGRVEQLGYQQFDAVYIPGGHAPMQDLLSNTALGKLLKHFHQQGKPTALVCHGPIALLSTLDDAAGFTRQMAAYGKASTSTWIYKGYNMTVISNLEEEAAKASLHGGSMKFYPQDALQAAGAAYASNTKLWEPKVVVDRELITGENPASAVQAAQALLTKLK